MLTSPGPCVIIIIWQAVSTQLVSKQEDRVRSLYRRRLSLPLLDLEASLARYRASKLGEGMADKESKALRTAYEGALKEAGRRRKLEMRISARRAAGGAPLGPWGSAESGGTWPLWYQTQIEPTSPAPPPPPAWPACSPAVGPMWPACSPAVGPM